MGSTIIYTTHYMEEAEELCSKISIMDHGKVIAEGTTEELKSLITNVNTIFVTTDSIAKVNEKELKNINGVLSIEINENTIKITSSKDINNLDRIILYFTQRGICIKNVESKVPDLETVFLTLTGRKLRD
jgi:ABC-2 type transport system ATP-binding protein